MPLKLILGPMKSGKSFELISNFAHLKYTDIPYAIYQSSRHVRDAGVKSRNGAVLEAQLVKDISSALDKNYKIVGIEEAHMFEESNAEIVRNLLFRGTLVIASGLDTDYKGEMFPIIRRLFELGPKEVVYRRAVCETCKEPNAVYTQVLLKGKPVTGGLPPSLPEDGTYEYKAVCRKCFVR